MSKTRLWLWFGITCGLWACSDVDDGVGGLGSEETAPVGVLSEAVKLEGEVADLWGVAGVAIAKDGTVAVVQPEVQTVRLFAATGGELAAVGGRGEGPGEFQEPFTLGWVGDSLTVYDGQLERFTVFSSAGDFGRTVRATYRATAGPGVADLPRFSMASVMRLRPNDRVVAELRGVAPGPSAEYYDVILVEMTTEGSVEDVLLRFRVATPEVRISTGNFSTSAHFPFTNVPRHHLSADGSRFVVAEAAVDGPAAGTYSVSAVGPTGDTLYSRTYPFTPVVVTDQYEDSVIEAGATSIEERSPRLARAYRREAFLPPMLPPVLSVLAGEDETVWVRLRGAVEGRLYVVLGEDGELIGRVNTPAGFSVRAASRDRIWGVVTDSLGMESLQMYGVAWPRSVP